MHNPQSPATPPSDIEQGKKKELDHTNDSYEVGQTIALPLASSQAMNNALTNQQTFCCCNSARTASIFWFSVSLILDLVALIFSCLPENEFVPGIVLSAFYLFYSIQGLIGCILVESMQLTIALMGVVVKAILSFIGIIAILASSTKTEGMEFEDSHRIDFIVVALATLLFYGFGVVVVQRVIKEKNASVEV